MPIYEYECKSCGGRFEAIQKFSDPVLSVCRLCNVENVRKVLSPTAFVLKGGGWYVTDHPSEARKKGGESEKSAAEPKPVAAAAAPVCAKGACAAKG